MNLEFDRSESQRVDVFLSETTGRSRAFLQKACKTGKALVNGKTVKPSLLLKGGEHISLDLTEEPLKVEPTPIDLNIQYEDDDVMIINKPVGLTVHPGAGNQTETLVNALLYHAKDLSTSGGTERPGIVHRLDKDTSGLLVVAKHNAAHHKLADAFKERIVSKKYITLVHGYLFDKAGTIQLSIRRSPNNYKKFIVDGTYGKPSTTEYKVLVERNEKSLVEVHPITGRTHQIRVHFSHLGHPLVGDPLYGKIRGKRHLLHAFYLAFPHPMTGKMMEFTTPFPKWAIL